jgi:hypothetical protein
MTESQACSWIGKTVQIVTVDSDLSGVIGRVVFAIPVHPDKPNGIWGVNVEVPAQPDLRQFRRRDLFIANPEKFKEIQP